MYVTLGYYIHVVKLTHEANVVVCCLHADQFSFCEFIWLSQQIPIVIQKKPLLRI